ncbi:MAG: 30S ribosomal protein S12 methylthiotransferase RimO [Clostridia bacterium]
MNVGFISLGCSKNLIDTEVAIGKFKEHEFNIVNDPKEADIIVVNTCGFIESAKEEAINTILEMAEYKNGRCKFLIAMGCLVQRYYKELSKEMPEVDLFLKIEDYNKLWDKVAELLEQPNQNASKENDAITTIASQNTKTNDEDNKIKQLPMFAEKEYLARTVSTGENYAYLKIGEGCSNMCTYCAIPYIRGLFISRKMGEILEEAKMLANKGVKEIIVIAQDTTKYGVDLYGESKLAELLQEISEIKGIEWIRFLYSYPEGITDELIDTVKNNDKICKYFDIPIQHISNDVLKRMNRKTSKENIVNLINKIRKEIPNVILRTSLIVGFPGETEQDFIELLDFVKSTKFDKLGVFKYSKEENTPAAKMPNQIHYMTKNARYRKIMSEQKEISKKKLEEQIGKKIQVLIENVSFDGKYLVGRTRNDVPEEDGIVYIKRTDENENLLNQFIWCKIVDVSDYDLIAEVE